MRLSLNSIRPAAAVLSIVGLMVTGLPSITRVSLAQKGKPAAHGAQLTEEQRIMRVLNRLGFGARAGDIERVKALGIQKYIEQQLNPSGISDEVAEAKVGTLSSLSMTTAQLYEKYPQPGQILRQLQRRGELPNESAAGREDQKQSTNEKPAEQEAMQRPPNGNPNAQGRNEENRRAIREYYVE